MVTWALLDQLQAATRILEKHTDTPVGAESDEIAGYSREGGAAVYGAVEQDEIWETVNPGLDRMLGFGRPKSKIKSILHRGPLGVAGLQGFFEYLVEEKGVVGALLKGKINVLLEVMRE